MTGVSAGAELNAQADFSDLFRAWLGGHESLGDAGVEVRRCLAQAEPAAAAPLAAGRAPAWATRGWVKPWSEAQLAWLPDEAARDRHRQNVGRLVAGQSEVIVTGQQPGFLGGPLYTLFKVATAILAASKRSEAGRPTLPLFWAGDDDDDRQEALRPLLFDPRRGVFLKAAPVSGAADSMVGAIGAGEWGRGEAAWLRKQAGRSELAAALARLWEQAPQAGWSWGQLQARALLNVFAGTDLLVVSGNDSGLHAAAAPFYKRLQQESATLVREAGAAGQELEAMGFHAQIGEAGLQRFLHLEADGRRLSLTADQGSEYPAAALRPGVAARSLVQDWLFTPAGVVVGPAELAYLKQLLPVYRHFGVSRSPLLPRLFASLLPRGQVARLSSQKRAAVDGEAVVPGRVGSMAGSIAGTLAQELSTALQELAGASPERARHLAERQEKRWRTGIAALLERERQRGRNLQAGPAVQWLSGPRGQRQERILAMHWATALWGENLVADVKKAAQEHLAAGQDGHWREFLLEVTDL